MSRRKVGATGAVALTIAALAAPASTQAQVDVEETCHALIGSQVIQLDLSPLARIEVRTCREADTRG